MVVVNCVYIITSCNCVYCYLSYVSLRQLRGYLACQSFLNRLVFNWYLAQVLLCVVYTGLTPFRMVKDVYFSM